MDIEERWQALKKHLGFDDRELGILRSNPTYVKMVESTPEFMTHKLVAEVINSHGCHSGLTVGTRIVMNGNGQLIRDECPENICIWALAPLSGMVNAVFERFMEGLDPNGMVFDVVHCMDVGRRSLFKKARRQQYDERDKNAAFLVRMVKKFWKERRRKDVVERLQRDSIRCVILRKKLPPEIVAHVISFT